MLNMPQEVITNILKYLDIFDTVNYSEVNKHFNTLVNTTEQLWELFAEALRIKDRIDPQKSIKKHFKISLGKDEVEIKETESKELRRRIRSLPFIETEELKIKDNSYYYNPIPLFNMMVPVRSIGFENEFVLCYPNYEHNKLKILKFYYSSKGPTTCNINYLKLPDGSLVISDPLYDRYEGKISLAKVIKDELMIMDKGWLALELDKS
jgi:hypothetical protein